MNPARNAHAYKQLRDKQRAKQHDCWLCGQAIDYQAPARSRHSFSLDHIQPLAHGGSLLDPTNAASAHYGCNSRRGARTRTRTRTSRRWVGASQSL